MTNTVQLKRSSVPNSVPSAGNLVPGELAINYADGNLFYKNSSNVVTVIASNQFVSVTGNVTGNYFLGNANIQYTASTAPATGNLIGAQWYNTSTDALYEWQTDGTSAYWVDITGPVIGSTGVATGSIIVNGTSNVTIPTANGNAGINIGGTANVAIFATTGEYVTGLISATGNITGGNITTSGKILGNYTFAQSGATSAYATQRVLQYVPGTGVVTYSNYIDASSIYITGYAIEIHVSPSALNNDGNGTIGTPVKTIARAKELLAQAFETSSAGQRKTIVLHPGDYVENVTIDTQFTVLTTHELVGKNTTLSGTLTITKGCTIDGLKMTNLVVSADDTTGSVDLIGCTVTTAATKTSSAYTVFRGCDLSSSTLSVTGSGTTVVVGGNYGSLTVNNAAAGVLVKTVITMGPVTLTAGTLQLSDSLIYSATNTSNAITQSAGSVITVNNCQTLIPALTNVARNSFGGFYSILNSVYDKTNSTFGGTSLASIVYSQNINADSLTLAATTLSTSITTGALIVAGGAGIGSNVYVGGNITGGNVLTGGLISATGNITGGNLNATGLSLSGNVVSAINTIANITTTANISGGNILGTHVGNVTGTTASLSGNITGGNILTAGLISATGNISANNATFTSNLGVGTTPGSGISLDVLGGEIKAGRIDSNNEGGQVSFGRATDNATAWYLDVYGNTSTPSLRFVDVGTGAVSMGINSSGAVALRGAVSATGVGITFPATQSVSSDANTLDDYEEGTWTPVLQFDANTQTTTTPIATYVKVGKSVTINMQIAWAAKSGSGRVYITGLPFAKEAGGTVPLLAGCPAGSVTTGAAIFYNVDGGGTVLNLAEQAGDINSASLAASGSLFCSGTYFV